MLKTSICELLSFVHPFVQPDYGRNAMTVEIAEVVIRGMKRVAILDSALVVRASKSKELACMKCKRKRG